MHRQTKCCKLSRSTDRNDPNKKAPEIFRKWAMTIANLILTGYYKYKPADFEARVLLICKDASNCRKIGVLSVPSLF